MRLKRALLVVCVLVAAGLACGRSEDPSGPAERVVRVDALTRRFNANFLAFFPSRVTVRPGDTVVFDSVWTGEPHTVALGTLVDKGGKLPRAPLDSNRTVAQNSLRTCFLEKGAPPSDPNRACPAVRQPKFDGRRTYYSSGLLRPGQKFRVPLTSDTPPGTYKFVCSVHGPVMSGEMTVVGRGEKIPTSAEVDEAGRDQQVALERRALRAYDERYKTFRRTRAGEFPWPASAGWHDLGPQMRVREFIPFRIKAKRNELVRWTVYGAHTISFKPPPESKKPWIERLSDGSVLLNRFALTSAGTPVDTVSLSPREPVRKDAGRYDGELERSSGLLVGPMNGNLTYTLRFTKPGTYRYQCLLHPRMKGIVTVTL